MKHEMPPAGSVQRRGSACIVVWDDEMGMCVPMGWDADCAGAICACNRHVAVFASRAEARRAIDISSKFAALCRAQGRPANDDFMGDARKNLRVVMLSPNDKLSRAGEETP